MRTMTILTLVAIAALSLSGCTGGWPRWLCRGDNCGSYGTYGEGVYSSPTLMAPSYTTSPELPGPVPGSIPSPAR
jgi:hypothetical protein